MLQRKRKQEKLLVKFSVPERPKAAYKTVPQRGTTCTGVVCRRTILASAIEFVFNLIPFLFFSFHLCVFRQNLFGMEF
jgi:hypothetical protein